jgi:hypothetical protein
MTTVTMFAEVSDETDDDDDECSHRLMTTVMMFAEVTSLTTTMTSARKEVKSGTDDCFDVLA